MGSPSPSSTATSATATASSPPSPSASRRAPGLGGGALASADEPRQLLDLTVDAYLAFIEREPGLYRFLLQQAANNAGLTQINPLIGNIARQVALVVGEQLRIAGLDSGGAVHWAYGIVGMVHQAGDWWLEDRTMPRETLVRLPHHPALGRAPGPASTVVAGPET